MAPSDALSILRLNVSSSHALISHLESAISGAGLPALPFNPSSPNALAVLASAAALLKAQVTKLSLLAINKPFSPSEISFILNSLSAECIPALASAAQLCVAERYTRVLRKEVSTNVAGTFRELVNLLGEIPIDGGEDTEKIGDRDTLSSTGVIWERCDRCVELGREGVILIAVKKVEEYYGLFKDAIAELEDWQDEEDEANNTASGNLSNRVRDLKIEDLHSGLSSEDWEIDDTNEEFEPRLLTPGLVKKTLDLLRLCCLLFPPLIKRRIKRFPNIDATLLDDAFPSGSQISQLDDIVDNCRAFSEEADEVAAALYEHDEKEVSRRLAILKTLSRQCIARVHDTWNGGTDEFTIWTSKWLIKLDEFD